jgi:hypothetical protein
VQELRQVARGADPNTVSVSEAPQPRLLRYHAVAVRWAARGLLALAALSLAVDVNPFMSVPLIGLAALCAFVGWTFAGGLDTRARQVLARLALVAGFCATTIPAVGRMTSVAQWHAREQALAITVAAHVASAERALRARTGKLEDSHNLRALHVQTPSQCDVDIELVSGAGQVNVQCTGHYTDGYGTASFSGAALPRRASIEPLRTRLPPRR